MSVDSLKTYPSLQSAPHGHRRREGLQEGSSHRSRGLCRSRGAPTGHIRQLPAAGSAACAWGGTRPSPHPPRRPLQPPPRAVNSSPQRPPATRRQSSRGSARLSSGRPPARPPVRAPLPPRGRRGAGAGGEREAGGRRRAGRGGLCRAARPRPFVQRPARLSARGAEVIEREGRGWGLGSDGV